jgi:hypothetical protein
MIVKRRMMLLYTRLYCVKHKIGRITIFNHIPAVFQHILFIQSGFIVQIQMSIIRLILCQAFWRKWYIFKRVV